MQFYDMHSHILPEFDDGAQSIEESLALLECLKKQNVKNVCLTPHFYTNEMSAEDFIQNRKEAYEKFLPHKPTDMNIVLGAEVYVTKYLFNYEDLSEITYGKSNYLLTEFYYSSSFSDGTIKKIETLIAEYGVIPVIPHVERYETLINNPEILRELKDIGVVIQTNANSYTKSASYFRKRKLFKLISSGLIDVLGTDAHSMTHNTPEAYSEALKNISDKCGEQVVSHMMKKAEQIFNSAI